MIHNRNAIILYVCSYRITIVNKRADGIDTLYSKYVVATLILQNKKDKKKTRAS